MYGSPDSAEPHAHTLEQTRDLCPSCGSEMQIIAFILEDKVVVTILRHLERKQTDRERGPPRWSDLQAAS